MAITVKTVSEMLGKDVFTNKGEYCGKVVDVEINLQKFRMRSLIIEASRDSFLEKMVGGRKGVILPYQLVDAIGDVVIIKHITTPTLPEKEGERESIMPF